MNYPDLMVDIETTHTDPGRGAIIQLSAVRFNLEQRAVNADDMFDRCLSVPAWRTWSDSTRHFWAGLDPEILEMIQKRAEHPLQVTNAFVDWVGPVAPTFWSRGTFDFMFIESYCADAGRRNPFKFWNANDIRSWLRGSYAPNRVPKLDIQREGPAHNALFDCLHQIQDLFAHCDNLAEARGRPAPLEPEILGAW